MNRLWLTLECHKLRAVIFVVAYSMYSMIFRWWVAVI